MKNPQKMADDNLYNVPVIPPDLRRDETIQQICNALDYLDQVADDVFQRISSRVTENHTKLKNINERVNHAQAKIDKIKGTSKATRVFSSAKYPAVKDEESYYSVFNKSTHKKPQLKTTTKVQSKHLQVDDKVLKEKLQFYNVQLSTKKSQANQESQGEGLGRLPENIPSVSSLLLFNTSENPYKKYVMFDPLGVVTKTRKSLDDQDDGLADAPSTITHREELQRQSTENYFYMPGLGEVPEIAVPDFLPDLAGIADDISYSADSGRAIAPSVPGSNMPDLPSVIPDIESIPSGPAPVIGGDGPPPPPPPGPPSDIPPPPPPPAGAPPPPPPPPPSAPPPPPPPPPPAEAPPPPPPGGAPPPPPPQGVPAPAAAPDTGRASLLDAIRNAGGAGKAKLRDAKVRKIESKKKKQEEKEQAVASVGGGDLMSALAAKLSMRRKGISGSGKPGAGGGNEDKSNSGSGGAMDRISAMIPPPPTAGSAPDKGGEEEDWS